MKYDKIFIFIILSYSLISCSTQEESYLKGEIVRVDPINYASSQPDSLLKEINYIPLETLESSYIGEIEKIIPFEDRYYVLNGPIASSVACFSSEGKFLFKIQAIGRGPGEYGDLSDFLIDKENRHLELLDLYGKILYFDLLHGNFIKEKRIKACCLGFIKFESGAYACSTGGGRQEIDGKEVSGNLIFLDENFELKTEFLSTIGVQEVTCYLPGKLNLMNNQGLMSYWIFPTIFQLTDETVNPLYTIDFGAYNIPDKLLYHYSYEEMESEIIAIDRYPFVFHKLIETPNYFSFLFQFEEQSRQVLLDIASLRNIVLPTFAVNQEAYAAPIYMHEDHLIGAIQPYELLQKANYELASPTLKGLLDTISETDNPILVKMKYADDIFESLKSTQEP